MGTLQVVATPIGNLEDVTLRALRVLSEADLVFAEDTRRTRILLDHHRIAARPISLNAQNEMARIEQALSALRQGKSLALVSDAGTPLVSDPGGRLVEAAARDGHRVEAIPGASAVLAALAVSGLRAQPFTFLGFLPRRSGQQRKLLAAQAARHETLVLFESPRRVAATLAALRDAFGPDRRACLARELTKLHEEVVRGTLSELAAQFGEGTRGEVTLVIEGEDSAPLEAAVSSRSEGGLEREIEALVAEGRRPREIAALLAPASGLPKRALYARALAAQAAAREGATRQAQAQLQLQAELQAQAQLQVQAELQAQVKAEGDPEQRKARRRARAVEP